MHNAALQICRSGAPQGRTPHPQHIQDLRLWDAAIQAGQCVRPIHLTRMMNTFAANLVHRPSIDLGQSQFRLAHEHTPESWLAVRIVYSCSVIYGLYY